MKTTKTKIKIWDLKDYLRDQKKVDDFNNQNKKGVFSTKVENVFKGDKGYLKSFK